MQNDLKAIREAGVEVVGISYDSQAVLSDFASKRKISFPLLSDPESKVIAAYALTNKEMAGKSFGTVKLDGVPYPGTVIVGKDGVIAAKLFVDGYKDRHDRDALLKAAKALATKNP